MASKSGVDGFDMDDEDVNFEHYGRTVDDKQFDDVISCLEDIILNNQFADMQNSFYEQHCDKFEETKENKLEYTEIFNNYTRMVEEIIGKALAEKIPGFKMNDLESLLTRKRDELAGEVFDTLTSMGDFLEFKELMLATKNMKCGGGGGMGGFDLAISGSGMGGGMGGGGVQGLSISGSSGRGGGGGRSNGGGAGGGGGLDLSISGKKL